MVVTESTITCPACGHARLETMPQDACQFFYECTGCGTCYRQCPVHAIELVAESLFTTDVTTDVTTDAGERG